MIEHISQGDFESKVLKSGQPVLVDFYAEWCGPCKAQAPILEEIAQEMGTKAVIVKLDVDQNGELAQSHGVMSIPTLMLFKNGTVVERMTGLQDKDVLIKTISQHI